MTNCSSDATQFQNTQSYAIEVLQQKTFTVFVDWHATLEGLHECSVYSYCVSGCCVRPQVFCVIYNVNWETFVP